MALDKTYTEKAKPLSIIVFGLSCNNYTEQRSIMQLNLKINSLLPCGLLMLFNDSNMPGLACQIVPDNRIIIVTAIFMAALTLAFVRWDNKQAQSCPPGPKPRWITGNEIPNDRQWLKFDEWKKKYGKLIYWHLKLRIPNILTL